MNLDQFLALHDTIETEMKRNNENTKYIATQKNTNCERKLDIMKTLLITVGNSAFTVPFALSSLELMVTAKLVEVERNYYGKILSIYSASDKIGIEVIDSSDVKSSAESPENRKKRAEEVRLKLEAELAAVNKEICDLG